MAGKWNPALEECKTCYRASKGDCSPQCLADGLKLIEQNLDRTAALKSPEVHNLTKEVLILSAGRDAVDRYFDVSLALEILRKEMNEACGLEG